MAITFDKPNRSITASGLQGSITVSCEVDDEGFPVVDVTYETDQSDPNKEDLILICQEMKSGGEPGRVLTLPRQAMLSLRGEATAVREEANQYSHRRLAHELGGAAARAGFDAQRLAGLLNIEPDRLNNGGTFEVVLIALQDGDDPDWIREVIQHPASMTEPTQQDRRRQLEARQEAYREAVETFADNAADSDSLSQRELEHWIDEALVAEPYCQDDDLIIETLRWSKFPTAELFHHGLDSKSKGIKWDAGREDFPFKVCALEAFKQDVMHYLHEECPWYADLPQDNPEEDDEDGEEDEDA